MPFRNILTGMPTKDRPSKGPRSPFGPSEPPNTSLSLTKFAKDVLAAAEERTGRPRSNVIDLLLRKHGGTVAPEDFGSDERPPCDATA